MKDAVGNNLQLRTATGELPTPPGPESAAWREDLSQNLRTHLNAIIGFAELLGLDPLPANARSDVKQILKAAREMLGTINHQLSPIGEPDGTGATALVQPPKTRCDVLYIEDDLGNLSLVERILALRPRLILKQAGRGQLGVELAKTDRPKLILLDLNLPDINGAEVLQILQRSPETAQIPVVMLSANAMPTQIERLLSAGARKYLTKPFAVDQVLAVVDEWIPAA